MVMAAGWLVAAPLPAALAGHQSSVLHPVVKLLKPEPTLLGDTVAVQVKLRAAVRGVVQVQQRTAGHWRKLRQAQIARRHTIRVPFPATTPGAVTYRVVVQPVGYRTFTGRPLRVHVAGTGLRAKPRKGTVTVAAGHLSQISGSPSGTETIKLAATVHAPVKGNILAVPATSSSPGVLGLVQTVVANGDGTYTVTTTPATLDQAYSSFSAAVSGSLGSVAARVPASASLNRRPATFPLDCGPSIPVTPTLDLSKMKVQFSMTANPPSIHFLLVGQPAVGLTIHAGAGFTCSLPDSRKLTIPVPGTPLDVTLQPRIDLSAKGGIDVNFVWSPKVSFGFDRAPGLSDNPFTLKGSAVWKKASVTAHADAYFAGELGVSLGGRAGITGSFGPDVTADLKKSSGGFCIDVEKGLKAELDVTADVFFKTWHFKVADGTFVKGPLYTNCRPSITTTSLAPAKVGMAYSQTLHVTGGRAPYTWSVSSGSLPAGLTLSSSTGAITGVPTTAGPKSFTVTVRDANGRTASAGLSIVVNQAADLQLYGPTSGPAGFGVMLSANCPNPQGTAWVDTTIYDSAGTSKTFADFYSSGSSDPIQVYDELETDSNFPPGAYHAVVQCRLTQDGPPTKQFAPIPVTVTGPAPTFSVVSSTVRVGGSIQLTNGVCPIVPGISWSYGFLGFAASSGSGPISSFPLSPAGAWTNAEIPVPEGTATGPAVVTLDCAEAPPPNPVSPWGYIVDYPTVSITITP